MASYQFSMEKILDWRSDLEEEAKRSFAQAQHKLVYQESVLQKLVQENTKIKNDSLKTNRIDAMRRQNLYRMALDEKIIQQKNLLDKVKQEVELAQQALTEAHTDKKIMEKLKEKEYDSLMELEKSTEQKQLDEIASLNYGKSYY